MLVRPDSPEVSLQTHRIPPASRQRVIRGRNGWWFLGPGGVARLSMGNVTGDGALTSSAEAYLRAQGLLDVPKQTVYGLTVLTSTDCNLGCGYCFQNVSQDIAGGNRPPRIAHARLTPDGITRILKFTERQMSEVGLERLTVLLFGGEPLLNPRGCVELLTRAVDYGLESASMISNMTLMKPDLAKELYELGLESVQVTFDGERDLHDTIRVRRSGGGTFDSIVSNVAAASAVASITWIVRVNVSHRNVSGIDNLVDMLADRLDTSKCVIYFARVGDVGIGYTNEMGQTASLAEQFLRWQRRATELGFRVNRPASVRPCMTCSYDNGMYGAVVNADGRLSSCWETAGKPGWEVGSIVDGYLPSEQTEGRWVSCDDTRQFATAANESFQDGLDAAFLDFLAESGRL